MGTSLHRAETGEIKLGSTLPESHFGRTASVLIRQSRSLGSFVESPFVPPAEAAHCSGDLQA